MEKIESSAIEDSNDEDEDTLSLSDLPTYCDDQNNGLWVEGRSTNLDTEQDFEFSSEMMIASCDSTDHIVFCGKIIGLSPESTHEFVSRKKRRRCMRLGLSLVNLHKRMIGSWRLTRVFSKSCFSESNIDSGKDDAKNEMGLRRVSVLASMTKSRWQFFMFGFGSSKFPKEMHIGDLRKRQDSLRSKYNDYGSCHSDNNSGDGPWGLIRFLGCASGGSYNDDAIQDGAATSERHCQTWISSHQLNK